jgi:hypothetical protein
VQIAAEILDDGHAFGLGPLEIGIELKAALRYFGHGIHASIN